MGAGHFEGGHSAERERQTWDGRQAGRHAGVTYIARIIPHRASAPFVA